jgi:DNA-binding MarR family transcriptional regulator
MLHLLSVDTMVRVSDLSEQLGVTTAGTTRMLDKLESLGYAARSRMDQYDQRQVYVTLTPEGVEALREAEDVFLERVQTILNKLSPIERATLARLLQSLSDR